MNNQLSVREQKIVDFKSIINEKSVRNRVRASMGENANSFIASMLDLYESDNALINCDARKVAMECLKAASLNLPIVKSLGFAYVVPYKNTPTFIVGYKGMIQLALRSGQYKALNADAIYEGEQICTDRISGQLAVTGTPKSGKAIGYFAYFKLINGFEKALYMTVEEIRKYAKDHSKAYNNGPWQTNFAEMAKKTVIRRILKYGPMSTEMQKAEDMEIRSAENAAQAVVDTNANREAIDVEVAVPIEAEEANVDTETGEILDPPADPVPDIPEEPGF